MDKILEQKINEKISESLSNIKQVHQLAKSLNHLRANSADFKYGIIVGRLYNSFFYQSRRVLKRNPTEDEFSEFLQILHKRQDEILRALGFL